MLQRLSGSDALFGVVDKDLPEEIQEKLVKMRGGRDDIFQALHGAHKLPRLSWGVGEWVGEMLVLEEAGGTVTVAALTLLHDFADKGLVDRIAGYGLEEVLIKSKLDRKVSSYALPSLRDALRSHGSGTEHLRSSTRLRCSQVTTDRLGGSSLC